MAVWLKSCHEIVGHLNKVGKDIVINRLTLGHCRLGAEGGSVMQPLSSENLGAQRSKPCKYRKPS